jgi:hypothetical protein
MSLTSPLLDVIQAKELVQANLAEALEKAKALELARKPAEVIAKQADRGPLHRCGGSYDHLTPGRVLAG